jgi:transketolase
MRTAFIEALCREAERDERIWLLTGDLGYSVLEPYADRFPARFVNVGVAEQNMTGVAAGLAMSGKVVFTYSIGNFSTFRCLEQIRNDVCYHDLDVKVVSVGGGLAYGALGYTHHAVEDLAVMRALPNLRVLAPGDPHEARMATEALARTPGPGYLRLGKAGEPQVHAARPEGGIDRVLVLREGTGPALLSTGGILAQALKAADALAERGVSVTLASVPTLQPLDEEGILRIAGATDRIVTLEEHGPGGLASAVAELLATTGTRARLVPLRLPHRPAKTVGSQEALRAAYGLGVEDIVRAVAG